MPHRSDRCQTRGSSARDCSSGPRDWVARSRYLEEKAWQLAQHKKKKRYYFQDGVRSTRSKRPGPAVVIQNDVSNQYSPITSMAAISSQFSDPPFPPKSSSSLERAACQDIRQGSSTILIRWTGRGLAIDLANSPDQAFVAWTEPLRSSLRYWIYSCLLWL